MSIKSKVKISQNFVTFSEYMNFNVIKVWPPKLKVPIEIIRSFIVGFQKKQKKLINTNLFITYQQPIMNSESTIFFHKIFFLKGCQLSFLIFKINTYLYRSFCLISIENVYLVEKNPDKKCSLRIQNLLLTCDEKDIAHCLYLVLNTQETSLTSLFD